MRKWVEFLAGRNSVREALVASRRRVYKVVLGEGVSEKGVIADILRLCHERDVPVVRAERQVLDTLIANLVHQGIVAQASSYPYVELSVAMDLARQRDEPPFLLALDSLQDPQNVGSLLRTAEAVGVHGVIVPTRRSVGITPAVSRASAGAVEHLLVCKVTNLARTLDALKSEGVWVVGVEDRAGSQDYRTVSLDMPLVLVVGSEGHGLRRLTADKCDLLLRIPMQGRISSLNVSVAGSIVLYEAWRARDRGARGGDLCRGKTPSQSR